MADFTTTTNLSLKKPAVGGSSDKWGEYLNADLDTIDTEIQSLKTASTSRSLESLSNVLDLTPTTGQLLQFDTANWKAATVTIPEDIEDLGNVTVSSPADGQVLAYSASNSRWENQTAGAATIPDGTITTAKLSTSLQGQVNLILQTTGTPTDDQILRYNATTTNWEFQDLPGGTISALSDTDVSGISNKDVLVYNSTSGDWVSRPLAIADVAGLQTELDAKLESSDLSVSSLTDTTITTTADNSVLVYDASDSKWKNEGPSTARTSLGLAIGTDVQAYDADTTKNDVSNTFSANQVISVNDNTNAALRITQTGSGNALVVEDSSPDSSPFVVDANGFVKIGTTTDVSPAGLAESPLQVAFVGSTTPMAVFRQGTNSTQGAELILEHARNGTTNAIVAGGDNLGEIRMFGADGTNMVEAASIASQVDGPPGTNDMPGRLVFSTTADGSSSPTERMRIDSAGNVGIGESSPDGRLHVSGPTNATNNTDARSAIFRDPATNQGSLEIRHGYSTTVPNNRYTSLQAWSNEYSNPVPLLLNPNGGKVGIGTTSPSQKLDVTGNINATGALTLGTALAIAEGGTGQTTAAAARIALLPTLGTAGQVLAVNTGASDVEWVDAASGGGSGTVTSVAISGSDGIEVDSGSPITTSGTIALGINAATLSSHLSLGTAATTAATDYATAAQGSLADSAVQPGDDANTLGSGAATDGYVLTADGAGGSAWEAASGGGGGTTAYVEHSSTISDSFTVTSGTNRMYIGGTTFSGTINVAGRLVIVGGEANFTGTINTTGVLAILGVP